MANVFTKRSGKPRTTTLSDYGVHDLSQSVTLPRILSPTRIANPHPRGLIYQIISDKKAAYGIWNPDITRIAKLLPKGQNHMRWVNFSSGPLETRRHESGKAPKIQYSETTTSRVSYRNPCLFPELKSDKGTTRFAYTPAGGPVKGIGENSSKSIELCALNN